MTANLVLCITHDDFSEIASWVDSNWVTWFKKQHSEFYECISHSLEIDRNTAQNVNALKIWFEVFNQIMMNNEIQSSDFWNFDETEFNIDMTENTVVLTKHSFRRQYTSSSENQIWISSIEMINVTEDFLSVFHILSRKCLLANWFPNCHSDDCLAVSDTDYSNEILDLEYLKKFNEYSMQFQQNVYQLFFLNNHNFHCICDFIEYCDEHKIISYALFSHTTHLMQSLDIILFQLLKYFHK